MGSDDLGSISLRMDKFKTQLAKAGARIADLLNRAFK